MVAPILKAKVDQILAELSRTFPPAAACLRKSNANFGPGAALEIEDDSDEDLAGGLCFLRCLICWMP